MQNLIETFKSKWKYIAAGLGLVAVVVLYNMFYLAPREDEGGFIRAENQTITSTEIGREIVSTLNRLKTISIDPEFFDEDRYRVLVDYSVEIQPQEVGKENPFQEIDLNTIGQNNAASADSGEVLQNVAEENLESGGENLGEFETEGGAGADLEGGQVI